MFLKDATLFQDDTEHCVFSTVRPLGWGWCSGRRSGQMTGIGVSCAVLWGALGSLMCIDLGISWRKKLRAGGDLKRKWLQS